MRSWVKYLTTRTHVRATCSRCLMGCLHDPANVQQTSSKCNVGRLLDRVNTLLRVVAHAPSGSDVDCKLDQNIAQWPNSPSRPKTPDRLYIMSAFGADISVCLLKPCKLLSDRNKLNWNYVSAVYLIIFSCVAPTALSISVESSSVALTRFWSYVASWNSLFKLCLCLTRCYCQLVQYTVDCVRFVLS